MAVIAAVVVEFLSFIFHVYEVEAIVLQAPRRIRDLSVFALYYVRKYVIVLICVL